VLSNIFRPVTYLHSQAIAIIRLHLGDQLGDCNGGKIECT
jgi:hypothetical protein